MAVDFQVVYPQEVVQLSKIRYTPPSPLGLPRSLDIIGQDFRSVDEVLINDQQSPDVIVLSKTRLLAQLPDILQAGGQVTSVAVISRRLTVTQSSVLRFRIGETPGRVSGIFRLMQTFLKLLFSTPGSDIFSKRIGGGGLSSISSVGSPDDGKASVSKFIIAVDTTAKQLLSIQTRGPRLPRDEMLLAAKVISAGFNAQRGITLSTVEITSQAGRAAQTNVEL